LFSLVQASLVAVACNPTIAGGVADGARVFAVACATCHGPAGTPPEAMAALLHVRDLKSPEFRRRARRDLIEKQVRGGSADRRMPAFTDVLTDAQIAAVANYVMGLVARHDSSVRD
jgi:mono/diheme cytochrome c family protein